MPSVQTRVKNAAGDSLIQRRTAVPNRAEEIPPAEEAAVEFEPVAVPVPAAAPPRGSWTRWATLGALVLTTAILAADYFFPEAFGSHNAAVRPRAAAEPGVTDAEILIGMSAAFTGPSRELGEGMRTGIEACLSDVNARGGVHGRQLRLIALDDGYEPNRCLDNMQELVERRHVFALLGNVGTPGAQVAIPYAMEKKRIFFGAFTGADLLRKTPPDRYVFNYRASYREETAATVRHLVERRGVPPAQIAVFAQNDSYGESGYQGVLKGVARYGIGPEQILKVTYTRNTEAVEPAVEAILKNRDRVKAIVMVPTYKPAAKFVKLLKDAGLEIPFAVVSFVNSEALVQEFKALGVAYANDVLVTQVVPYFKYVTHGLNEYEPCMRRYIGDKPLSFTSLEGYLAASIFVEGLRKAGPDLTTEGLVDTLEGLQNVDVGIGTRLGFRPNDHQASHRVWGTLLDAQANYQLLVLE
jgi:ABC-type branched-subunit amino acid transport system substrate-binding protein